MTNEVPVATDNHADDHVDDEIIACLDLLKPTSFFLFADAGSGKTRSLVTSLESLREKIGNHLRLYGKRIGVITYTNAACDEIKRRLEFDPLLEVSTIHSFVWSLISGHDTDIKQWLRTSLAAEISELENLQSKGKPASKAALDRVASIKAKRERVAELESVRRFTYNPLGDNRGRDSLNHSEVIKIGADFLSRKPVMQHILIGKFPILLIDESQDTNKLLIEALLKLQQENKDRLCLGLFGDTMQRIYGDGKEDLGEGLPPDWARPTKRLNHRCPQRIIELINKIRSSVDGHVQTARLGSEVGAVRLFLLPAQTADKPEAERRAAQKMASLTGDELWTSARDVKTLTLEHHMAAQRMGFLEMFRALNKAEDLRTGLRDGSLPGLRLFSHFVLPLIQAKTRGDEFGVAAILRTTSPLLNKDVLKSEGKDQRGKIREVRRATSELTELWTNNGNPRFLDVLRRVSHSGLFEIPESLRAIAAREKLEQAAAPNVGTSPTTQEQGPDVVLEAWDEFLLAPFAQIEPYNEYISGEAPFDTHQGVKGLEFPRVMVVMDDTEARGFMFSYEKLFGAKDKSDADLKNEREGKETSVDRTRRLFYVTCSRTQKSLAIVAYSDDPKKIRDYVLREGWFEGDEVQMAV